MIVDGDLTNPVATVGSIAWETPVFDLSGTIPDTTYAVHIEFKKKSYRASIMNVGNADVIGNVNLSGEHRSSCRQKRFDSITARVRDCKVEIRKKTGGLLWRGQAAGAACLTPNDGGVCC